MNNPHTSYKDAAQGRLEEFLQALGEKPALRLFSLLESERARAGADMRVDEQTTRRSYRELHRDLLARMRRQLMTRDTGFPPRIPNAKRLFYTPFEDFFIGKRSGQKTRARIARTSLDPIWALMMSAPACVSAARAAADLDHALEHGGAAGAQEVALFIGAEAGLGRLIAHAHEDAAYHGQVLEALGGAAAFDDLQELRILLGGVEALKKLQALVVGPAASLTEEQVYELRDLFLSVHDQSHLLGGYLLLALKGRLEKPWRALSVYYHLAESADERLRAAKDAVNLLPQSLFEDLESMARALERAAERELYPQTAKLRVTYFSDYADGVASQSARIGDNVFVNRVEACRDVAGAAFERFLEQAIAAIRAALPVRHAGGASRLSALRPDVSAPLGAGVAENARDAGALVAAAPDLAARLGRDGAFAARIVADARGAIEDYAEGVVTEIRAADGAERDDARRALDRTLDLAAPLLDRDAIARHRDRAEAAALVV
ncbi:MAG: hypothetical protein AAGA09_02425 [Pseudomonadota bacterium]